MLPSRLRIVITILGVIAASVCAGAPGPKRQASLPLVEQAAAQPLIEQVKNLQWLMENRGMPLSAATRAALEKAYQQKVEAQAIRQIQAALDPYCLLAVHINPEARAQ